MCILERGWRIMLLYQLFQKSRLVLRLLGMDVDLNKIIKSDGISYPASTLARA
jgi:hypothetical protein